MVDLTKDFNKGRIVDALAPQGGNVGGNGFLKVYHGGGQLRTAQMATGQAFTVGPSERIVYSPDVGTITLLNEPRVVSRS